MGFQILPFFTGAHYWSVGANNNLDTAQGFGAVPVLNTDPSSIFVAESGNQIIASVATVPDLAGTMPLLGLGLGALAAFGRRFRK